jgi:hypothetical protein
MICNAPLQTSGNSFQVAGASIFAETPDLKTRPTCHSHVVIMTNGNKGHRL